MDRRIGGLVKNKQGVVNKINSHPISTRHSKSYNPNPHSSYITIQINWQGSIFQANANFVSNICK